MLLKWDCYEINQVNVFRLPRSILPKSFIIGALRARAWLEAAADRQLFCVVASGDINSRKILKRWNKVIANVNIQILVFFDTLLSMKTTFHCQEN